jgi:hypothetical protein
MTRDELHGLVDVEYDAQPNQGHPDERQDGKFMARKGLP